MGYSSAHTVLLKLIGLLAKRRTCLPSVVPSEMGRLERQLRPLSTLFEQGKEVPRTDQTIEVNAVAPETTVLSGLFTTHG